MKSSVCSLCLLASLSVSCLMLSVGVSEGQFVPGRCECYNTKKRVRLEMSDFRVILKSHICNTDQIIVVLKTNNSSVCVDPNKQLGKKLLQCWKKAKAKGVDVKRCLKRKRTQENKEKNPQRNQTTLRRKSKQNRRMVPV
ncbi:hypothetical protein UPYG_G00319900 [Umbra pygmaea]|uniref:Chemokine interleukin-8-like domain-containing protein n=1 Tax=Umbra pygmaea TaxID=75934 RepID=A0ABD0WNI2_UMBPY